MATESTPRTSGSPLRVGDADGDPLDRIETEIAVLARALERQYRRSELFREIDRAGYLIARTLEVTGPVSINALAATLGLDATTVTRQVATMEASRLVVRRTDEHDGRVSRISLSPQGRRVMRSVQLARKERLAGLLGAWSETDRRDFGRLLAKFNDALGHDTSRLDQR